MKQTIRLVAIFSLCFVLASCTFLGNLSLGSYSPDLVDDKERMLQAGDSFFYRNRDISLTNRSANLSFRGFHGIETLYRLGCDQSGTVTITTSSSVDTTRYKLVLVDTVREEVITLIQGSGYASHTHNLKAGRYHIKTVGYDVGGTVSMSLSAGQGVTVSTQSMR